MEAPEEDAEFLTLASPAQGVTLKVTPSPYTFGNGIEPGNGMAWSNHFGWCVIAQPLTGFSLFSLSSLRDAFKSAAPHSTPTVAPTLQVPTQQPIDHIKFAMGDKLVVTGFRDGTVGIWRLKSLVERNTSPLRMIPSASASPVPLLHVLPNPAPSSPLLCIVTSDSPPVIHNLETSSIHSTFPTSISGAKCASWSVKGKQIVIGTSEGRILQLTPEGQLKAELPLPRSLVEQGGDWQVKGLEWLENHVFLVTYSKKQPRDQEEQVIHEDEVFVLTRDPKQGDRVEETRFMDPTPAFGMMDRLGRRWVLRLKNWEPFKHLLVIANAPSSDIGLLSQSSSTSSWASLALSDASRPTLPQSSTGEEVCPLGLELDLSDSDSEKAGKIGIWCLTSEGVLVCWKVTNEKAQGGGGGGSYEGLVESKDVLTREQDEPIDSSSGPQPTPTSTSAPALPSAATPSAFGAGTGTGGFGGFAAPTTGKSSNPTGFGSTGFGFASSSPSTTSTPSTTNAAASPAFGTLSKPTFGSSSGFGSFASSAPAPPSTSGTAGGGGGFAAFGSSTTTAPSSGFSAFGGSGNGSGGGGGGGFGSFSKPSTSTGGSVFGSGGTFGSSSSPTSTSSSTTTTQSAFGGGGGGGGSAFGSGGTLKSTTTKSVFGSSASTPGSGSGFAGFGSSGSTTTPSAFGSTTSSSSSSAPKPTFSFAAASSSGTPSSSMATVTRPRGGSDSGDDEDEDKGMGDNDDDGGRVDEPPDLEPTKSGLDIGESMKEAAEAKSSGGAGTFGFGGLGVGGGGGSTLKEESKPATPSIFGTTATPSSSTPASGSTLPAFGSSTSAFGSGAPSPAFGSSSSGFKPATGFSFGQQSSSKPTTPVSEVAAPSKKEEEESTSPAPKPAAGFSFGATSTPSTAFPKPATTGGFGGGGFGAFSSPSTSTAGGGGGFASFSSSKKEEGEEGEKKTPSAFSSFGTATGGVFGSAKKDVEAKEAKAEEAPKNDSEPVTAKSPFSFATSSSTAPSTADAPKSEPPKSTSAFGFGGTASSTSFPKPASPGGFGAFSSGGGGFSGSVFGSSGTTTPKPATRFSFAPAASAARPTTSPSPAPSFSFAALAAPKPTPTTEDSDKEGKEIAGAKDIEEKKDENGKPVSTKSLFGFASSPTEEKDAGSSLLSRMSASKDESDGDEPEEGEESFEGTDDGVEYDEEEEEKYDDEGDEYEEDASRDERNDEEEEEGPEEEPEIPVKEEETEETVPPASTNSPSLLSRLSPAPVITEASPPAAAPSPSPVAADSKPPSFSFGAPPSPSPSTTTPSQSPAQASKSPFSFASPASPAGSPSPSPVPASKPSSFLGFTSSAPRSSSPLSAPPLAAPPAFSSAPKISSPLSFAPQATSTSESKSEAAKSPFGGFGGFGTTPAAAPSTAPSFSFGGSSPAPATPKTEAKPSTGGFSFGSTSTTPAAPASQPSSLKPPAAGFSFGPASPLEQKPSPSPISTPSTPVPKVEEPVAVVPKREAVPLSQATAPRVGPELVKGSVPPVEEKGMAGEFLKAYLSVQRDFEILRANASIIKDFAKDIAKPLQAPVGGRIDYDDRNWSLGDLQRLREITKELRPSVEALHGEAIKQKTMTAELQSQMLRAETKREEAARFVRARNDPAFAKMIRIRQLGPEQIENQRKIRLQMEAVRSRLEQLEEHLLALKTKVNENQKGRSTFKAPSLDSVNRAVRNITVAVTEKTFELDKLAQKLDQIRLGSTDGTPLRRTNRHRSPSVALEETINQSSVLRQSPGPNGALSASTSSPSPSPAGIAAAKAALDAENAAANLKKALLGLRSNKALKINRSASAAVQGSKAEVATDLQLSFAKVPVTADRLPRPRRQAPPPSPRALSPIPLLPVLPPVRASTSQSPSTETPKAASSAPVAQQPVSSPTPFSLAPSSSTSFPAFSLPPVSAPNFSSFGAAPAFSVPPPAPSFGGFNSISTGSSLAAAQPPPPLFPSLNLKSAPQISFSSTPLISTPPASTSSGGARGSASRTSKDRNHSSAAQLKPSTGTPPVTAASSFDWGPLPSNITGGGSAGTLGTPSKPAFSFAGGAGGGGFTPSQGISPSGFVSLGSPFASSTSTGTSTTTSTSKPASNSGGFSFGISPFSSATASTLTPSKPPPTSFSFGAPVTPDDGQELDSEEEEEEEENEDQGEFDEEEYGEGDEDWEGEENYDEQEEEGLDTIGEEEEEGDYDE